VEEAFDHIVNDVSRQSVRRHARWDPALFQEFCQGPARALWGRLKGQAVAKRSLAAYLELVREAIGAAYLVKDQGGGLGGRRSGQADWPNFLAFCLVKLIPEQLPALAADRHLPLLARVWNLCEGLLQEPAWVDRFVVASAGELTRLEDVEAFLVRVLEPALTPAAPSGWKGPFRLSLLDTRPVHDDFLPGEMYLAAPMVLCVRDRRHPDVSLGVFLRPRGKSQSLGLTPSLDEYAEQGELPPVNFADHEVRIGGQAVELPFLRRRHRHALARSGFLVASAVDSQRLWIVESP
jgi:hypothetical protein